MPRRRRLLVILHAGLPPLAETIIGAILWAALMAASGVFSVVFLRAWETPILIRHVAILFAFGGLVAFPLALYAARLLSLDRQRGVALAAAFLSFSVITIGVTALAFALYYRSYYAQWHADIFSVTWIFQFVFTIGAAVAQFAALGMRMFFPIGFLALVCASLWFSAKAR